MYKEQARESDRTKREALLHRIQQLLHERVRFGPIFDYVWPSGVGPRVEDPALMLIDPYPWSAPLEEVRLRRNNSGANGANRCAPSGVGELYLPPA
jgi:peptide/nickel transport system substrate-binding protein